MKVCPQCGEVADLTTYGICEGCEEDERQDTERQWELEQERRNGEIFD